GAAVLPLPEPKAAATRVPAALARQPAAATGLAPALPLFANAPHWFGRARPRCAVGEAAWTLPLIPPAAHRRAPSPLLRVDPQVAPIVRREQARSDRSSAPYSARSSRHRCPLPPTGVQPRR